MSKRDFDEYYRQHKEDTDSAMQVIAECTAQAQNNMMSDQDVQRMVQTMSPIIEAQKMLDHIAYLLNKPARHTKYAWYDRQHASAKNNQFCRNTNHKENEELINNFKRDFNHDERNN